MRRILSFFVLLAAVGLLGCNLRSIGGSFNGYRFTGEGEAATAESRGLIDPATKRVAVHNRFVAHFAKGIEGELVLARLELLQADHIGLCLVEPTQHEGQTRFGAVDVPGCDLHVSYLFLTV